MSQTMKLSVKGLHTYYSEFSGVPAGALSVARNVDITRQNIVGPRRGYNYLDNDLPLTADRASKLVFYSSELFAHYNDATFSIYDTGSGFLSRGSLIAPTAAPSIKNAKMNKNLFLTSSSGLQKMDDTTASIFQAGLPQGIHTTTSLTGAGTAVVNGDNVGYRYLIGVKDANNNLILGGVSSRSTIANGTGSTQNITVVGNLPDGLSTSHFVQLYRSIGTTGTPSDEMQLAKSPCLAGLSSAISCDSIVSAGQCPCGKPRRLLQRQLSPQGVSRGGQGVRQCLCEVWVC